MEKAPKHSAAKWLLLGAGGARHLEIVVLTIFSLSQSSRPGQTYLAGREVAPCRARRGVMVMFNRRNESEEELVVDGDSCFAATCWLLGGGGKRRRRRKAARRGGVLLYILKHFWHGGGGGAGGSAARACAQERWAPMKLSTTANGQICVAGMRWKSSVINSHDNAVCI